MNTEVFSYTLQKDEIKKATEKDIEIYFPENVTRYHRSFLGFLEMCNTGELCYVEAVTKAFKEVDEDNDKMVSELHKDLNFYRKLLKDKQSEIDRIAQANLNLSTNVREVSSDKWWMLGIGIAIGNLFWVLLAKLVGL